MSAEIVNLRRLRKAVARSERDALAAENRIRHGRTKAERAAQDHERRRTSTLLDGARLDSSAPAFDDGG